MAIPLKQSTASQEVPLGPFLDETDGITPMTALTIANTDIKVWKTGATTLANKNSGGATHISGGIYYAVFDATDSDTLGPGVVFCHPTGALPVRVEIVVLPANAYDASIAGSDTVQVDVTQWNGTAVTTPATAGSPVVTLADSAITAAKFAADAITAAKVAADVTTELQSGLATAAALSAVDAKIDIIDGNVDDTETLLALIDADVTAILADTGTDGVVLASGAIDSIHDEVVEGALTHRQVIRLVLAAVAGKLSGAATTTVAIRDVADAKDRITATVDADGNRTAVTLDAT
jgi:hypothetical protein